MSRFSIYQPQNLSKSETMYAYKRYVYKIKKHVILNYLKYMLRIGDIDHAPPPPHTVNSPWVNLIMKLMFFREWTNQKLFRK